MRRQKKQPHIILYDQSGACGTYALIDYPLPEDTVIELSILFYDDPEPCHIHRAAVLTRAMAELMQGRGIGIKYPVCSLSEEHRRFFAPRVSSFSIEEEAP